MRKILILFAHPALERSRVQRRLLAAAAAVPAVTICDLYETYPDFAIDVQREQTALLAHDVIVWQHPLYWYSTPPLLKQWIDLVLEHGWAYGSAGTALRGKWLLSTISSGGGPQAYQPEGLNRYPLRTFLTPLEQTAALCGMEYLPPFAVQGTHRMDEAGIAAAAAGYAAALEELSGAADLAALRERTTYATYAPEVL